MVQHDIYLSEELDEFLEKYAIRLGVSVEELIVQTLINALKT